MSLCLLNDWCNGRFAAWHPASEVCAQRYDIAWIIMDNSAPDSTSAGARA